MPTYVYKFIETGETIEVQQSFADDTLTEAAHPQSGEVMAVKKVFQPVGVTFRGSGFFKTDNRGSSATTPSASGTGSGDGGDSSSSGSSDSSSGTSSDSSSGSSESSGSSSGSTTSTTASSSNSTSKSSTPSSKSTSGD